MNRPFCYAPWLGVSLRQDGEWKPCGAFQESLGRIDHTAVVDSDSLRQLKEQLLAHTPPSGCSLCLLEESQGRYSKRLKIQEHVKRKSLFATPEALQSAKPIHLELAFSNRCNFTCTMCSAEYSSSWRNMVDEYAQSVDQTKSSAEPVFQISNEQRQNLLELSKSIQTLQVLGGEPLYDQQFHKYLAELANINPNCDVCIATNGSLLTANFLEKLNQFSE